MLNLSKLSPPREKRVIKKFGFQSNGVKASRLLVTIEYLPPETLNAKRDAEKTRVLTTRRHNAAEDIKAANDAIAAVWNMILADRVQKIEGLTALKLGGLLDLDPVKLGQQLGTKDINEEFTFNRDDQTQIAPAERERLGLTDSDPVTTLGELAGGNILFMVNGSFEFQNFLQTIIADVGQFQGSDWEAEVKNSKPGATSNSAAQAPATTA